jgi:hypothetical protein
VPQSQAEPEPKGKHFDPTFRQRQRNRYDR